MTSKEIAIRLIELGFDPRAEGFIHLIKLLKIIKAEGNFTFDIPECVDIIARAESERLYYTVSRASIYRSIYRLVKKYAEKHPDEFQDRHIKVVIRSLIKRLDK